MSRPFIPAPNCASVELIYTCYSQVIENVFHIKAANPFSDVMIVALRSCFNTWDLTYQKVYRNTNVLLSRIRTKALDSTSSPMEDYALPTPRAGDIAGAAMPLNVTFCFKLATGLAGRSQRGRLYVPGVEAGAVSGNQVVGARVSQWLSALNQLQPSLTAASADWKWGVLSYRADKTWRSLAQFTAISSVTYTDLNVDSQRRRLTGRGRT